MKNNPKLKSSPWQQMNFATLMDLLKHRLKGPPAFFSSAISVYHDPGIKTIATSPDLFISCIMLVIKQAIDTNNLDNHIRLAFFYIQQGINFVIIDRYHTYEQAPFTKLNLMLDVTTSPDHPYFHIIQSLKILKKVGGTLQMLKIGEEIYYPSFRFEQ